METTRRKFIEICVAGAAPCTAMATTPATPAPVASAPLTAKKYNRVKLVDTAGRAIKAKSLKAHHNYVFNYPYASTPCFLLNLDKALPEKVSMKTDTGGTYDWPGGVGISKSIVAYSAICAHKLAYPTSQVSFIAIARSPQKSARADKSFHAVRTKAYMTRSSAPRS